MGEKTRKFSQTRCSGVFNNVYIGQMQGGTVIVGESEKKREKAKKTRKDGQDSAQASAAAPASADALLRRDLMLYSSASEEEISESFVLLESMTNTPKLASMVVRHFMMRLGVKREVAREKAFLENVIAAARNVPAGCSVKNLQNQIRTLCNLIEQTKK